MPPPRQRRREVDWGDVCGNVGMGVFMVVITAMMAGIAAAVWTVVVRMWMGTL